jgi:hypothetical protein
MPPPLALSALADRFDEDSAFAPTRCDGQHRIIAYIALIARPIVREKDKQKHSAYIYKEAPTPIQVLE